MTPVAWSQLEPTQCETLVSVLLLRSFPDGVRIRPSRGDGGIDVLVPVDLSTRKYDVYQIKYFWRNLSGNQKKQIVKSISSIKATVTSKNMTVRNWHLTMPLNPTRENLKWIQGCFKSSSISPLWKGLDYLEGLAAEYGSVVDYYVHNGAGRTADQIDQMIRMTPLLSGSDASGSALDLEAVRAASQVLFEQLNRIDPHYYYEIHVTSDIPDLAAYANARTMMLRAYRQGDGPCVTVAICTHFIEAPVYRPLSVNIRLIHNDDPNLVAELEDFRLFGGTLRVGPDRASVQVAGDPLQASDSDYVPAIVEVVSPPGEGVGQSLRLVVHAPNGSVASILVTVLERTVGPSGEGLRVRMRSRSGGTVFRADFRLDAAAMNESNLHIEFDWYGKLAVQLVEDAEFYQHLVPGCRLFLAPEYGTRIDLFALGAENLRVPVAPDLFAYVGWLAEAQPFADGPLTVPEDLGGEEFNIARMIATLISGGSVGQKRSSWKVHSLEQDIDGLISDIESSGEFSCGGPPLVVLASGVRVEIDDLIYKVSEVSAVRKAEDPQTLLLYPSGEGELNLEVKILDSESSEAY